MVALIVDLTHNHDFLLVSASSCSPENPRTFSPFLCTAPIKVGVLLIFIRLVPEVSLE